MVIGNRHDMRDAADLFDGFDAAIVDIYEARAKLDRRSIEKLMDAETFMGPSEAVEKGFADSVSDDIKAEEAKNKSTTVAARNRVETILARAGVPRSERRKMLREVAGTPGAAGTIMPSADLNPASVRELIDILKT
jgi:hypothetical protein